MSSGNTSTKCDRLSGKSNGKRNNEKHVAQLTHVLRTPPNWFWTLYICLPKKEKFSYKSNFSVFVLLNITRLKTL